MNTPIVEGVNSRGTGDETFSLSGHEREDVSSAASKSSAPVISEDLARQIKAATNPLTRHSERLWEVLKELRKDPSEA